ncbi:hypothetical protein quinque_009248 [Culex quinquefasciatus]
MNTLFYKILLITIFIQHSFQAKPPNFGTDDVRPFHIRVLRLKCLDTPYKLITLKACNVKLVRNEPTRIFLEFDMPTTLDQMFVTFNVNYKINHSYRPLLIDISSELCATLNQKPGLNPAADYVLATIRAHVPQAVHACPYGGRYYNFSDFSLDEKYLPNTIPAGDYRIDLRVTDKRNVTMIHVQCFMAARSKGIASLSMLDW